MLVDFIEPVSGTALAAGLESDRQTNGPVASAANANYSSMKCKVSPLYSDPPFGRVGRGSGRGGSTGFHHCVVQL